MNPPPLSEHHTHCSHGPNCPTHQRILTTNAMAHMQPSLQDIPCNTSRATHCSLIRERVGTGFHYVASLAALPRELSGMVDPTLAVHSMRNLSVADTSIFPVFPVPHRRIVGVRLHLDLKGGIPSAISVNRTPQSKCTTLLDARDPQDRCNRGR